MAKLMTGPLEDQPSKVRRSRARNRALLRLRMKHAGEYSKYYREELEKAKLL